MPKTALKTRTHPTWCLNHNRTDLDPGPCIPHASGTVTTPATAGAWVPDPNGSGIMMPAVETALLQDPDGPVGIELTIVSPLHEVLLNAGDRLENRLSATLTPMAARDLGRRLIALADLAEVA